MRDQDRYVFDVHGYIKVEQALDPEQVAELNAYLDGHDLWAGNNPLGFDVVKRYNDFVINAGYLHTHARPIRSLIAAPAILPYLQGVFGQHFRYDEGQVLVAKPGAGALVLHNGGTPWEPVLGYQARDGRIHAGHVVAAFCLTDASEEDGGFAVIPGSHKAALPVPDPVAEWQEIVPWVRQVSVRAGDVILFADGITHGSWPWLADTERRVIFCRYTHGMVQHASPAPDASDGLFDDWTPVERRLIRPPFAWHFHEEDGRFISTEREAVLDGDRYVMDEYGYQIIDVDVSKSAT